MSLIVLLHVLGYAGALLGLYMVFVEPRRLKRTEVEAPIDGLPGAFEGYTIAVLTDLHYGPIPGHRHYMRAVEMVHAARPDLIVLLGDYGQSTRFSYAVSRPLYRHAFRRLAPVLQGLHAPDGVVGVLGNHDYYYNGPAVAHWLRSIGVRVLVNEHVLVERAGSRLAIGGVDDSMEGTVDPLGGCAGVPPEVPRVILSHNPDGALALAAGAGAGLVLSGHTHGGQIVAPLYGAPIRNCRICDRQHASGWVPAAPFPLYVSTGVGCQAPLRFNCRPEVVVVRLTAGARGEGRGARVSPM
jgi:uncharacterized protein